MARGTVVKRGKHSWRLKYDLAPDPVTGERRTVYGTVRGTKKDAQAELTRRLADVDEGFAVAPSKLTFAQWAEHWLVNIAPSRAGKKACQRYGEIVRLHLNPTIGYIALQKLDGEHVDRLFRELRQHNGKPLANATVMHVRTVLSTILKAAVVGKKIRTTPMATAQALPRSRRNEVRILNETELASLYQSLRDGQSPLYVPVLVAGGTGLRRGELLAMRWRDIDFEAGTVQVRRVIDATRDGLRFKEPKTDRSRRTITIGKRLVQELRAHRRKQAEWRLGLGLGKDEDDLVFTGANGGLWSPMAFTQGFIRAVVAAGLPRVRFHSLRHAHISDLLRNGVPVHVVSRRAGHSSPVVTLNTYSHVLANDQDRAAELVDTALTKALGE